MRAVVLLSIVGLMLTVGAFADVAGTYDGSGVNPDGSTYNAKIVITKTGDVYRVQWYLDGALGYEGVGVMKDGLFCVGFAGLDGYGTVVYEIKSNGSLEGVWLDSKVRKLGTESLNKG